MKSLEDFPDWIRSAAARTAGSRFGRLDFVAVTGSTNADLLTAALAGQGEGALVADHQTAGRGRLDRRWEAPAGANLLVSVLVRPDAPLDRWPLLTTAMALSVVETVEVLVADAASFTVGIRWPNDVMTAGPGGAEQKLAGVLAEVASHAGGPVAAVVGVGINVAWPADPADAPDLGAVSLEAMAGRRVERADVLAGALDRFAHWVGRVEREPLALATAHRARSLTLGREVRVVRGDGTLIEGRAVDIDDRGAIVLDRGGSRETFRSAEVTHLR